MWVLSLQVVLKMEVAAHKASSGMFLFLLLLLMEVVYQLMLGVVHHAVHNGSYTVKPCKLNSFTKE